MLLWNKHIFSWLLVLIMAISPVQVTMAIDVDQGGHGDRCQTMSIPSHDTVDSTLKNDCPMGHGDHCKDHAGCVGQFNSSTMQIPYSSLFVARPSAHNKFTRHNDAVDTVYPSLLKRPPKA